MKKPLCILTFGVSAVAAYAGLYDAGNEPPPPPQNTYILGIIAVVLSILIGTAAVLIVRGIQKRGRRRSQQNIGG